MQNALRSCTQFLWLNEHTNACKRKQESVISYPAQWDKKVKISLSPTLPFLSHTLSKLMNWILTVVTVTPPHPCPPTLVPSKRNLQQEGDLSGPSEVVVHYCYTLCARYLNSATFPKIYYETKWNWKIFKIGNNGHVIWEYLVTGHSKID